MQPLVLLASERTADGEELTLTRRGEEYYLNIGGSTLMSSRSHGSELALARLACAGLTDRTGSARPRVLVGGLGFGYTLRAALDQLPPRAEVEVREISALVLEANVGEVGALAGRPLDDPRVTVVAADVREALGRKPYDAILLDVDDGPRSFTLRHNARLYAPEGLALIARSLVPGGVLAVWSASPDEAFARRLAAGGFEVQVHGARGDRGRGLRYTIFVGRRA